jgi:hypothetical protein
MWIFNASIDVAAPLDYEGELTTESRNMHPFLCAGIQALSFMLLT